jgi:hypothetical protein
MNRILVGRYFEKFLGGGRIILEIPTLIPADDLLFFYFQDTLT